ncbi:hypothetical protein H5P28_06830 [Ruficoccus amylovorans]|uniref:Uncharacterized protein n=1 Tax=Ruficoccus amylovorans TaxID=1804625 RepID=A0A842HBY0_9BACT|nr:hypothetical protein [Ruficoccus amylovorans]MBC2593973.1 hypothetical protein [Ruficoccus amylovorans]
MNRKVVKVCVATLLVPAVFLLVLWGVAVVLEGPTLSPRESGIQSLGYETGFVVGKGQRLDGRGQDLPADALHRLGQTDAHGFGYRSVEDIEMFVAAYARGYDAGLHPRTEWWRLFKPNDIEHK